MPTKKMMEPIDMEARLERAFRPVRPSQTFVRTVRGRIGRLAPPVVVVSHLDDSSHFLLLVGGIISATLLLVAGVRALFYIVNKSKA